VGWQIKKNSGKKKVILELGGNAGVIIHSDADLEYAAGRCVAGSFGYAGQTCISVQGCWYSSRCTGKFVDLFLAGVKELRCGDPVSETTDVGPLIRESDAVRATDWIQEAVRGGARVLCGGSRKGSLLEPTVLTGTRPDMKVNCQEIFAPWLRWSPTSNSTRPSGSSTVPRTACRRHLHARREADVPGV